MKDKHSLKLLCPACKLLLEEALQGSKCCNCGFEINSIASVAILRELGTGESVDYLSSEKTLPRMNSKHLTIPRIRKAFDRGDFMLELGAGVDICDAPNLVKTDAFVYSPHLDYVVDAHSMPFQDNTFDFVYSLAVFEHLHSPWVAAKEIFRVLKPGGKVYILTAFMQHMHGYPDHYFNMTTMGLRRIFSDFHIIRSDPSLYCPLSQLGVIMDDLKHMSDAAHENKDAQKLSENLASAIQLLSKVEVDLVNIEVNHKIWNLIAPGVEIVAMKPN